MKCESLSPRISAFLHGVARRRVCFAFALSLLQCIACGIQRGFAPSQIGRKATTATTVASATKLSITAPAQLRAGDALSGVEAQALLADGTLDTTYSATITLEVVSGAGPLTGTVTATASGGVATFNAASLRTSGNPYLLRVTATGLTASPNSTSLEVLPNVPDHCAFQAAPVYTITIGVSYDLNVDVLDAYGNLALAAEVSGFTTVIGGDCSLDTTGMTINRADTTWQFLNLGCGAGGAIPSCTFTADIDNLYSCSLAAEVVP